ncbi:ribonuclease M5 [Gemelliphila palaticanis]|uniref:Ribonuclease M5 n=1 Tax=Gemelliphila palaticanis TaxID=81950 RepID=A0ABX2T323_9BACL|nr:ribonuclease M5 [Gemella palaticanis]MBF0715496.1 ribonuclease M5 [Gemella palaticanis]NYS47426.1 ribonuclease M5 [Gemella palaticanis]
MKIKEIIVVEGRDDTNRVKEAVDCDTFETNGSAITKKKIDRLKVLAKNRGIIVLTDPDYAGKRIRSIIEKNIPTAKHAYISNKKAVDKKGKIGIEAASKEDIIFALEKCYTPLLDNNNNISRDLVLSLGLIGTPESKILREQLCEKLNIEYSNGKQLVNKLNMYNISEELLLKTLEKIKEEN